MLNIDLFSFISENLEELKKEYEKVMEMIKQKPKEKSKCMRLSSMVNVFKQNFHCSHWCLNIHVLQ